MLSKKDREIIQTVSKKYNVKRVILFGSSVKNPETANDIDLAVEGLHNKYFFRYCGELYFKLSKPVDLVDLTIKSKFSKLIKEEGIVIYG